VYFTHSFVSETHLEHKCCTASGNVIVYPIREMVGEYKLVGVRLFRISDIRTGLRLKSPARITGLIGLYKIIESIVVKFGRWNLLERVDWVNIERWTFPGIPVLHLPGQGDPCSNFAGEISIGWSDPRSGIGDQCPLGESRNLAHLAQLPSGDSCVYDYKEARNSRKSHIPLLEVIFLDVLLTFGFFYNLWKGYFGKYFWRWFIPFLCCALGPFCGFCLLLYRIGEVLDRAEQCSEQRGNLWWPIHANTVTQEYPLTSHN